MPQIHSFPPSSQPLTICDQNCPNSPWTGLCSLFLSTQVILPSAAKGDPTPSLSWLSPHQGFHTPLGISHSSLNPSKFTALWPRGLAPAPQKRHQALPTRAMVPADPAAKSALCSLPTSSSLFLFQASVQIVTSSQSLFLPLILSYVTCCTFSSRLKSPSE